MAAALATADSGTGVARGIAFALLSYVAFATGDAAVKLASGRLSVFQIAVILSGFALLPTLSLMRGRGPRALLPKLWGLVLTRGLLTALCAICAWKAFALLPLAEAYAILFAAPILVTAMAPFLLKEHVGWRRASAAAVGFAGVLVMIRPDFDSFGLGHALAAMAAGLSALSFIVLRRIGARESAGPIVFFLFVSILGVALPFAVMDWVRPTAHELALLGTAGLLQGAAQVSLVMATRSTPAAIIAPFQYTQLLWAVAYGILVFGDLPQPTMYLGMALVICSGLYILWRETVRRRVPTLGAARGEVPAAEGRGPPAG
jgi:S-adenosylmethionine uptake transporter